MNIPLNQILYGPPGTGKTYSTIQKALKIIAIKDKDLKKFLDSSPSREELKDKFDEYRKNGQIEFITFHQSYSYEEFIEGLKATTNENGNIEYNIEDGVFKSLVEKAKTKSEANIDEKIDWLKEELLKNDIDISENTSFKLQYTGGKTFRVTPEKTKNPDAKYPVNIEKIKKLYKNEIEHREVYNGSYAVGILEYLYKNGLKKYNDLKDDFTNRNFVLIIDEINRGNISNIFGELITLIEPSKRLGNKEALEVKLPYSKDTFGVPKNLYIIGTMNSADKSVAPIDGALRRRFKFIEILPDSKKLKDNLEDINLQKLLEAINIRIEYLYNREHTIGHSYFMNINNLNDLKEVFKNNIIPLLAEYFYEDWEKIKLILNDNKDKFIVELKDANNYLKNIQDSFEDKKLYKVGDIDKLEISDFKNIHE